MDTKNYDNRLSGDTPLRQTQLILLRLLKAFDSICHNNNLTYWLDAGTLLGAVRHGGFIPWDDDIDVIMPFDDYQKFCSIAIKELPFDMFFQSSATDIDYICPWVKIRDRFSHLDEQGGPYPYSQAASIDIFPVINATKRQRKNRSLFAFLPPYNRKPEHVVKHLSPKSKIRIMVVSTFQYCYLCFLKIPFIKQITLKWFNKGDRKWIYLPPIRWNNEFPDSVIFPLTKIKFEDAFFPCPADSDAYLTSYFGDYMTLPPPEKRCSEHAVTQMFPIGPNPHFSSLNWSDYYDSNGRLK